MPFERLIKTNRIKEFKSSTNDISRLLQLAKRDIGTAERNLPESPDWAYSIAYNSILQAGRALMFNDGYRPRGGEQHATVVEFIGERLWEEYSISNVLSSLKHSKVSNTKSKQNQQILENRLKKLDISRKFSSSNTILVREATGDKDVEIEGIHPYSGHLFPFSHFPDIPRYPAEFKYYRLSYQISSQLLGYIPHHQRYDAAIMLSGLLKVVTGGTRDIQTVHPGIAAVYDPHQVA